MRNRKQVRVNEAFVNIGQKNTNEKQEPIVNNTLVIAEKEPEISEPEIPILVLVQKELGDAADTNASVSLADLNIMEETGMETQVSGRTILSVLPLLSAILFRLNWNQKFPADQK